MLVSLLAALLFWRWDAGSAGIGGVFVAPALALIAVVIAGQSAKPLVAFSGEPLAVFALAPLAALAASRVKMNRSFLLPCFAVVYSFIALRVQSTVSPNGDEPQYLMVADSLIRDHDLALDQDFAEKRYTTFHPEPLEPHFRVRGRAGQIYSLHAVGLSILILPAYAAFGYKGASLFLAVLGAFLVREIRRLVEAFSGRADLAQGIAWLCGLTPPLIHYAGLVFTEIPAALFVAIGIRQAMKPATRSLFVAALCAAALPWLNVRYAILSAAIAVVVVASRHRDIRGLLPPSLILTGSATAISLFHWKLWGFFDPRRVYGRTREFDLAIIPTGLPGLFFDQEFGLFVYAPIYALAFAGLVLLWKRNRGLAAAAFVAVCGVISVASAWPMWRGGFNPPARFLVPLIPFLALGLAASLVRVTRVRPALALFAGWSLWCGLTGAWDIASVHRDRDGTAPFFRNHSGALEWNALLPSFVLDEDRRTRSLAWPWATLLAIGVAATLGRDREEGSIESTPLSWGLAGLALLGTATYVGVAATRPLETERTATRLLNRNAALSLSPLGIDSPPFATLPLPQGGLIYEPHRYPAGQIIAHKLSIGPTAITVEISADSLAGSPPSIALLDQRESEVSATPLASARGQVRGAEVLVPTHGTWSLALKGGDGLLIRSLTLRPAPR